MKRNDSRGGRSIKHGLGKSLLLLLVLWGAGCSHLRPPEDGSAPYPAPAYSDWGTGDYWFGELILDLLGSVLR